MKPIVLAVLSLCLIQPALAKKSQEKKKEAKQMATLLITEKGFEPGSIQAKPGLDTVLQVTRKTDHTCAKALSIPAKNKEVDLPLNKTVEIELGKLGKGELRFACGMGMMSGKILVE